LGHQVTVFDRHEQPGHTIRKGEPDSLPADALTRDLNGILSAGIQFKGERDVSTEEITRLASEYAAVFVAAGVKSKLELPDSDPQSTNPALAGNVLIGGSAVLGPCSAVRAVASGRLAAQVIDAMLADKQFQLDNSLRWRSHSAIPTSVASS
jgi:NADPH-dependent glutamate synthase beta subunit-like oxidoreductase